MSGMFAKKVANAKPGDGQSPLFEPGFYPLVQINRLKLIESKKPGREGVEMFIISADVLESQVAARPAGMADVCQILNSQHVGAADDAKRFLMAIFPDVAESEWDAVDEQGNGTAIPMVTGADQMAQGRLASVEVYVKKNEKTGKSFTKHSWSAVPAELQAKAKELRAKVGLPPF